MGNIRFCNQGYFKRIFLSMKKPTRLFFCCKIFTKKKNTQVSRKYALFRQA